MTSPSTFMLQPVTLDDIPALTDVWYAAFSAPLFRQLWPDTPAVRGWWDKANRDDLLQKPFQRYIKMVDPQTTDARGRPRIAAYAKWDLSMPEDRGRRFPPWHPDCPGEVLDGFFKRVEDERCRLMGDQKHYYLDTVATHPDYQRRGAGSRLVKWGCELADTDGVAAYVDATKDGAPLYQKHGFVNKSEPGADEIASMVRAKRT